MVICIFQTSNSQQYVGVTRTLPAFPQRKHINQTLKARVKARNRANQHAVALYQALLKVFKPLVGKQVMTVQSTLLAKYQKLLPKLPNEPRLSVHRHSSGYSLAWLVKASEMIEDGCCCVYEEAVVYVGSLDNNVLRGLNSPFVGRSDYTVKEVEEARRKHKEAKKVADSLQSALFPFGESDR